MGQNRVPQPIAHRLAPIAIFDMSLHKLTLHELQEQFTNGEVTAREIVYAYSIRVNQVEPKVKAFITLHKESAMAQAEALDQKLKAWRRTMPLMGCRWRSRTTFARRAC